MTTAERAEHTPADRTHFYIDIENLVGCGRASRAQLIAAWTQFKQVAVLRVGDLITVGCDAGNALEVGLAFPGARIVWGHGRSGADIALLEAIQDDLESAQPSRRITVGSGDHIFAPLLSLAATQGFSTRVVGIEGPTSARLRIAAQQTTLLPDFSSSLERVA